MSPMGRLSPRLVGLIVVALMAVLPPVVVNGNLAGLTKGGQVQIDSDSGNDSSPSVALG